MYLYHKCTLVKVPVNVTFGYCMYILNHMNAVPNDRCLEPENSILN